MIMKIRKTITMGIIVTFVIQVLVVISLFNSSNNAISKFPEESLNKKLNDKPNIFGNYFYQNEGQFGDSQIYYYGYMHGGSIWFGESKILLKITNHDKFVTMFFENAQAVKPVAIKQQESTLSYFIGNNGGYSNIIRCEKIAYYNLWPGIDLFYKITEEGIKYEFHVNVGANVHDIKIRYDGQDNQPIILSDKLILSIGEHQLIDEGLCVFQQNKFDLEAKFISHKSNSLGFDVGNYDTTQKLIIDPLIYSTYIGGSSTDFANDIVLDEDGNTYIVGSSSSLDFPTSVTAYNDTFGGVYEDIIVSKLSADGSTMLYSTFIGGNGTDIGMGLEIDDTGCVYITGCTDSHNFPTVNALDDTYNGKNSQYGDCFLLKLSSDGSSLLYSTYYGGNGDDTALDIRIDNGYNMIFTGKTTSTNFPLQNEIDDEFDGMIEAFFAKISADGSAVIFSTYYGEVEQQYAETGTDIELADNG
ncbi:MAG: hypothetical protein FK732_08185, partial [Asgard group archaeon]|nr:hypothetical protein [Asgard group archaeon]